jgi:hypothetical protein
VGEFALIGDGVYLLEAEDALEFRSFKYVSYLSLLCSSIPPASEIFIIFFTGLPIT